MITKITSTPNYTPALNLHRTNAQSKPVLEKHSNYGLNIDTVSFSGNKTKTVAQFADEMFEKLAKNRFKNQLGFFAGKTEKANFAIQETVFGKKAKLSIVIDSEFANLEISREHNKPSTIRFLDDEVSSKKAKDLAKKCLNSIE